MHTTSRGGAGAALLVVLGVGALIFAISSVLGGGVQSGVSGDGTPKSGFSLFNFSARGPDVPRVPSTHRGDRGAGVSSGGAPTGNSSVYTGKVTVSKGTASSARGVQDEYITLFASPSNPEPIVITGWSVRNTDQATGQSGGVRNTIPAETVFISVGAEVVKNSGGSALGAITLNPGDSAYVITGEAPDVFPALLNVSFRTNACVGYFADAYDFSPSLATKCPDPEDAPGAAGHDTACLEYIDRLIECEVPNRQELLDRKLSNSCRAFVQDTYDYQGCVATYEGQPGFLGTAWYVYLDHLSGEMWNNERDTITVFDEEGKVVDWLAYD